MRSSVRLSCLFLAMLALVASSWGQATPPRENNPFDYGDKPAEPVVLSPENKGKVLSALADVITKEAFIPGVDLSKWPEFQEKQREYLDKAESEGDFARAINRALREFGVSHIRFITTRAAERRRGVMLRQAGFGTPPPPKLEWLDDEAAILSLRSFAKGYDSAAIDKLVMEANEKAKFLVVDLRWNGGGAVSNLTHFLGCFLPPSSEVGTFIYRRDSDRYSRDHGGVVEPDPVVIAKAMKNRFRVSREDRVRFNGKIAVLTNRATGSASEIFAAAMREHYQAPLIGTPSAGAVLASVYRRLPLGFEIQYPISDYVTRDGVRLEGNPLKPDIEIRERPGEEKDPVVVRALERLRTGS